MCAIVTRCSENGYAHDAAFNGLGIECFVGEARDVLLVCTIADAEDERRISRISDGDQPIAKEIVRVPMGGG